MASPQLHPQHNYTVIPRVLIFAQYKGCVLLLKGAPTKPLWPNLYNGVGGHVEPGETISQAASRELVEETGLAIPSLMLCGMVNIDTPGQKPAILLFIFTGEAESNAAHSGPEGSLEWFTWGNLPTESMMPDLPALLPRVRKVTPQNQPFYALYTYLDDGSVQITFSD